MTTHERILLAAITLAMIAILAACEKEVRREYLTPRSELRMVSCTTSGICGGIEADGTYSYGFKLSCPGTRQATVLITPFLILYESGRVRRFESTVTQQYHGGCKQ